MVLAAQESGAVIAVCDLVHSLLVVGVVLRIHGDLLHDGFIAGQLLHNILNGLDVVAAGCAADPGAAPVVGLRAFAHSVIAVDTVANFFLAALSDRSLQRVAQQGEVDAPGGVEEAEHLTGGTLIGCPLAVPQAGLVVIALIGVLLGLIDPLHNVLINGNGSAGDPRSCHVVGEGAVCIIKAGQHLVALGGCLCSYIIELIPVGQVGLHFGGIIGAQNILGNAAAVCKQTGSCLPGGAALAAVHTNDVLGVLVLASQIVIGQADVRLDIQNVIGIHILQSIISLDQEDVDLVVISSAVLTQQGFVQLVLIVVVLVGIDGPLHNGAILQGGGGLVGCDLGNFRIVVVEAALELIVPAPDVQHLALCCGSSGSSRGSRSRRSGAGGRRTTTGSQSCTNGHGTGSEQEITARDLFHKGKPPSWFSIIYKSVLHKRFRSKSL